MILDKKGLFDDGKALTSIGTTYSDVLPMPAGDIGRGTPVYLHTQVVEAFASGTSIGTLAVTLQHSSDGVTYTDTVLTTGVKAVTDLTVGTRLFQTALPVGLDKNLRLKYVVAAEAMTAGKLTSGLNISTE